jgi:transcriptional regulator with XRE-family HTH domain
VNVIGPRVKVLRERSGLTQEQLAEKCLILSWSISRGTLAKIESQCRRVTDKEVIILSEALAVSIEKLFNQNVVKQHE